MLTIGSGNRPCVPAVASQRKRSYTLWMEWTLTTSVMQLLKYTKSSFEKSSQEEKERGKKGKAYNNIGTNKCTLLPIG